MPWTMPLWVRMAPPCYGSFYSKSNLQVNFDLVRVLRQRFRHNGELQRNCVENKKNQKKSEPFTFILTRNAKTLKKRTPEKELQTKKVWQGATPSYMPRFIYWHKAEFLPSLSCFFFHFQAEQKHNAKCKTWLTYWAYVPTPSVPSVWGIERNLRQRWLAESYWATVIFLGSPRFLLFPTYLEIQVVFKILVNYNMLLIFSSGTVFEILELHRISFFHVKPRINKHA